MRPTLLCLLTILFLGVCGAGFGQPQIAVIVPASSQPNPDAYTYFENATGTLQTTPSGVDVQFQFLVPARGVGTRTIPARLTLSARNVGLMHGQRQSLEGFLFEVRATNPSDVIGDGVLLRGKPFYPEDFVLADIYTQDEIGYLASRWEAGLILESSYITIDPDQPQTALWEFPDVFPLGRFAPGENGLLRDTVLHSTASATFTGTVREDMLAGTIHFEEIAEWTADQQVTFVFTPTSGGGTLTRTLSVGFHGRFSLTDVPRGRYRLTVRSLRYLHATLFVDTTQGASVGLDIPLRAGDANNDNSVDILDLDILLSAFDTAYGDPAYELSCDFNNDNFCDILDLDLMLHNFDTQGDT